LGSGCGTARPVADRALCDAELGGDLPCVAPDVDEPTELTRGRAVLTSLGVGRQAARSRFPKRSTACSRTLARRVAYLDDELDNLAVVIRPLVQRTAPGLLAMHGVGYDVAAKLLVAAGDNPHRLRSEAAFAHLCGVAPLEASSGKTRRHRLNRGGDRQANNALYRIVITRMASHPPTKIYVARRRAEGKSTGEIIRILIGGVWGARRLVEVPCLSVNAGR